MATIKWVFEVSTNEFLFGGFYEPDINIPDPANPPDGTMPDPSKGIAILPRHPDPRTERHDGVGGIRPATPTEITDWESRDPGSKQRAERDRLNSLPDSAAVKIGDLRGLGLLD